MMIGELIGVGIVALSFRSLWAATIMIKHPDIFTIFKYAGGLYLGYLGVQLWLNRGKMALSNSTCSTTISATSLALQGFVTAIANPKGWAFFIALLPPFINQTKPLIPQISVISAIILTLEFICMIIYASGGNTLRLFAKRDKWGVYEPHRRDIDAWCWGVVSVWIIFTKSRCFKLFKVLTVVRNKRSG